MVSRVIAKAIAFVRIKIQVKQWQSPPPYASNLSSKSVFLDLVTHPGLKLGLFGLDLRFPLSFDDLLRKRALETTPLLSSSIFEVKRRDWLRLISRLGMLSIQRLCTQKYHMSHYLDKDNIINDYKVHDSDTGSCEVQIALLSARINHLTEHLRTHRKDYHSRRGLIKMTSRRRKLLDYLKRHNLEKYAEIIQRLGLRR